MPKKIDLTGNRYGRLLVLREITSQYKGVYWLCLCDCGNEKAISGLKLRNGNTKSCRCLNTELNIIRSTTHGMSGTTEHHIWKTLIQRCTNKNSKSYKSYGGRGITVCDRWRSFENFYADMGKRPDGLSLDRIDNEKGYSPENCRWATRHEQANNKRSNTYLYFNGETKTIANWAREVGIKAPTISRRIHSQNWTVSKALTKGV